MITKLFLMAFTTTLEIINPDNEPFAQVWNLSFFSASKLSLSYIQGVKIRLTFFMI